MGDIDFLLPVKVAAIVALIVGCCLGAVVVRYGPTVLRAFQGWVAGL